MYVNAPVSTRILMLEDGSNFQTSGLIRKTYFVHLVFIFQLTSVTIAHTKTSVGSVGLKGFLYTR